MLINLGSLTRYNTSRTEEMVGALEHVLTEQPDLQVLWKFNTIPAANGPTEHLIERLDKYMASGRVKISKWLDVDPAALLETGLISVAVHHGGANCYWEAVGQVIPRASSTELQENAS